MTLALRETRTKMAERRQGWRWSLTCKLGGNDLQFDAQFNFHDQTGDLRELFARPFRTGADLEDLLDKFCIGISMGLQHGISIHEFARVMGAGAAKEDRDIFSALIAAGVEAEAQKKRELLALAGAGHA